VHEAELVGILLGLHLILTEKNANTTFSLGVDNQAAMIRAFQSNLKKPGPHLTTHKGSNLNCQQNQEVQTQIQIQPDHKMDGWA
jgi:hypothetical protein